MTVRAEERSVYGKKVRPQHHSPFPFHDTLTRHLHLFDTTIAVCRSQNNLADIQMCDEQGKEGMLLVKTQKAILVAHYPENVQPGSATTVVEKLADYLVGVGY